MLSKSQQRAAEKIGRLSELVKSGGGSDANVIAGFGILTVNLAVGYEDIHTTNERIPVEELTKLAENGHHYHQKKFCGNNHL